MATSVAPTARRRSRFVIAAAAVVVLVALVAGAYVVGRSSVASASPVTLTPADEVGSDPFTDSVQVGPAVEYPANVRAVATSNRASMPTDATGNVVATGTAPGLYGGSGSTQVCDPTRLVSYLQNHRGKAAAWSRVLGVRTKDIAAYVSGLTPVLLTSDTLVTNHGYRDGAPTTVRSVLQAGTAVMVDARGVPRVKCNCGNPLTPAAPVALSDTRVVGHRWVGWSTRTVVVVRPGTADTRLQVIDPTTGDRATVPVGSTANASGGGSGDGTWVVARRTEQDATTSTVSTSQDGAHWTDVGTIDGVYVSGLADGNGTWLAVGSPIEWSSRADQRMSIVLRSTDLAHWTQVARIEAAGSIAYADGRWVAVGSVTNTGASELVAHTSTDGTSWTDSTLPGTGAESESLSGVTHQGGVWIAVGSVQVDDSAVGTTTTDLETFSSADGVTWKREQGGGVQSRYVQMMAEGTGLYPSIGGGPDGWVELFDRPTPTGDPQACDQSCDRRAGLVGSGAAATGTIDGEPFDAPTIDAVAWGGGSWLVLGDSVPPGEETDTTESYAYASTDGRAWTKVATMSGVADALAYGGR